MHVRTDVRTDGQTDVMLEIVFQMFITSEKENFKVCTTGGAKIRSQNDLKASLREKKCWQAVRFEPMPPKNNKKG